MSQNVLWKMLKGHLVWLSDLSYVIANASACIFISMSLYAWSIYKEAYLGGRREAGRSTSGNNGYCIAFHWVLNLEGIKIFLTDLCIIVSFNFSISKIKILPFLLELEGCKTSDLFALGYSLRYKYFLLDSPFNNL